MAAAEIVLAKKWYVEENLGAAQIAHGGRNPSSISRLVVKEVPQETRGRSPLLSPAVTDKFQKQARGHDPAARRMCRA